MDEKLAQILVERFYKMDLLSLYNKCNYISVLSSKN